MRDLLYLCTFMYKKKTGPSRNELYFVCLGQPVFLMGVMLYI